MLQRAYTVQNLAANAFVRGDSATGGVLTEGIPILGLEIV